jgi:hypothetical protein
VTLNITALTPNAIYQSADFMLSDLDGGHPVSDAANKIVLVRQPDWDGLITFTGIASWQGMDTENWIAQQIGGNGNLSHSDVVEILQVQGTKWLREVARSAKRRPLQHTFVVASFESGSPVASLVSSFERLGHSAWATPSDELVVSTTRKERTVIVTGCLTNPVSRQSRRVLERFTRDHGEDTTRVRHEIQKLNAAAARRGGCPISTECVVYSLRPDGDGQATGGPPGWSPRTAGFGMDNTLSTVENFLKEKFPAGYKVVGSSFTSSRAQNTPAASCDPQLSDSGDESGFELVQLEPTSRGSFSARAGGGDLIVGSGNELAHRPSLATVWNSGSREVLSDLGGLTGSAVDVDGDGNVAGSVEDSDRNMHACLWGSDRQIHVLGHRGFQDSAASRITDDEHIVGRISLGPRDRGQERWRPAIWNYAGDLRVLENLTADWAYARDAQSSDRVLLSAYRGNDLTPLVWEGDRIVEFAAGFVAPVAIGETGRVFGWTRDHNGEAISVVSDSDRSWKSLDLPTGAYLGAVSEDWGLAGHLRVDGFERPWVRTNEMDRPVLLPHFAYHHHRIASVTAAGVIVGNASSDHGSHPLVWAPNGDPLPS